jgi:hypothetical protein
MVRAAAFLTVKIRTDFNRKSISGIPVCLEATSLHSSNAWTIQLFYITVAIYI